MPGASCGILYILVLSLVCGISLFYMYVCVHWIVSRHPYVYALCYVMSRGWGMRSLLVHKVDKDALPVAQRYLPSTRLGAPRTRTLHGGSGVLATISPLRPPEKRRTNGLLREDRRISKLSTSRVQPLSKLRRPISSTSAIPRSGRNGHDVSNGLEKRRDSVGTTRKPRSTHYSIRWGTRRTRYSVLSGSPWRTLRCTTQ